MRDGERNFFALRPKKARDGKPRFAVWLRERGLRREAERWRYRAALEQERLSPPPREPEQGADAMWELAEFRRYAEAVNAERYRVTCIKMDEDGGKKTFIIDREYAEAARGKCARPRVIPSARPVDPARACYAHLDNIRRHLTIEDYSRVDAMIALRMRANGHSREAVAEAIRNCASTIRENPKGRDWQRYAERTVDYAFGYSHRNYHMYRLYMHMMQAIYTKIRCIPYVKTYR